jgi:hypothetical protein
MSAGMRTDTSTMGSPRMAEPVSGRPPPTIRRSRRGGPASAS